MYGNSIPKATTDRSVGNSAGSHEKRGGFGGQWGPRRRGLMQQSQAEAEAEESNGNPSAICRARLESCFASYLEL